MSGTKHITRARFELGLRTLAGRRLLAEVQRQLWKRLPDGARTAVLHKRCEDTRSLVLDLEKVVFDKKVTNMFEKYKPRIRFNMWRRMGDMRRARELAIRYEWKRSAIRGVRALLDNLGNKRRRRRLKWLADRHAMRLRTSWVMRTWIAYTAEEVRIREESIKLAVYKWNRSVMMLRLHAWRVYVFTVLEERAEALARAVWLCNLTLIRKVFHAYKTAAHELHEERIAQANQQWFAKMMEEGNEERELRDMAEDEARVRAFYEWEADVRAKREEKEYWERQRKEAEMRIALKAQEEERLQEKERKLQAKLSKDHETWEVLASKGAERVSAEAERWLETPMGQQYLKETARVRARLICQRYNSHWFFLGVLVFFLVFLAFLVCLVS
jgi:hypothetical protein